MFFFFCLLLEFVACSGEGGMGKGKRRSDGRADVLTGDMQTRQLGVRNFAYTLPELIN